MKKVIFSGIQPSGNLHIGNYIGAIKQWVELQNSEVRTQKSELFFCIVDLHAITIPQDPKILREKILEVAALYIACGIDPQKSYIFIQSENPDHTYLAWIFDTILTMGQLFRMTQFKDKALKYYTSDEKPSAAAEARALFDGPVGLFNYPALMAADILLYQTDEVPVGEDQKQHIELTRGIAERFNKTFGEVFKLPEPRIIRETARIMSLANPAAKMSKSDKDPAGTINLLDSPDEILDKVKRAVTDSNTQIDKAEVENDLEKGNPTGIGNLLTIYASIENMAIKDLLAEKEGMKYATFKQELAEKLVQFLAPIQERYHEIRKEETQLQKILDDGRDYAISKSSIALQKVKDAVGTGRG